VRRLFDTEILVELMYEAFACFIINRIQELRPIAFKMALESAGETLRANHKYLGIGIVSHRLAVLRLPKAHAATSSRVVIETASCTSVKDFEQLFTHFSRNVL
jgi:hypothetical protein